MKRDPALWLPPLVALFVLFAIGIQLRSALGVSGAFGSGSRQPGPQLSQEYVTLDAILSRARADRAPEGVRDPFKSVVVQGDNHPRPTKKAPVESPRPAVPSQPILTAILYDNDPRALLRWKDRDWTVRQGGLFDEFQVVTISRTQVTLRRGAETVVLLRRNPGDNP
jgi:hypothetical protein